MSDPVSPRETAEQFAARVWATAHQAYTVGEHRDVPCSCAAIPVEGVECFPCWARRLDPERNK